MPKPYQVCKGVFQVGGSGLSHPNDCSVYVVDAGSLVMIDAGAGESFDELVANIKGAGLPLEKLKAVIVTHAHIDHVGPLSRLRQKYGLEIIVHELDAPGIETGRGIGAEFYGVDYRPCPVDRRITGEDTTLTIGNRQFRLLHIPGHTPGSLAVVIDCDGNKVLFGQDIHGPYLPRWGGDPVAARKSLQKLLDLKADILCEGHFGVYRPAEAVDRYIRGYLEGL